MRMILFALALAGCASAEPPQAEPAPSVPALAEVLPVASPEPVEPVPTLIRTTVKRIVMPTGHQPLGYETDVWLIKPGDDWPACVVVNGGVSCDWKAAR